MFIYSIIKDKYIQLQRPFNFKYVCFKYIFIKQRNFRMYKLFKKKIEFWNINHYYSRLIYTTDELGLEYNLSTFIRIMNLKDNDHLLIDSNNFYETKIYCFSYINRNIIKVFKMYIEGFCLSKNNTLFVIKKDHILLFNIKKEKLFKINRLNN